LFNISAGYNRLPGIQSHGTIIEFIDQQQLPRVRRSCLGVMIQDITPELEKKLNPGTDKGALVSGIAAVGPASRIGIQRADAIIAFNRITAVYARSDILLLEDHGGHTIYITLEMP
jgi:S1-C subfamily serine protease